MEEVEGVQTSQVENCLRAWRAFDVFDILSGLLLNMKTKLRLRARVDGMRCRLTVVLTPSRMDPNRCWSKPIQAAGPIGIRELRP